MLQFVGDNARQFTTKYGNISTASIGAIQRALLEIEQQGGDAFFGEPMLDVDDLLQTDGHGPRHGQRPRGRRADPIAEALRDLPAVDAVGAVRAAAGGRRSRQADAGVLLRRGAPAVHRRAAGAHREDRAGRAADPIEGRRRLLRHAEPGRRARHRARTARQPRAARAARLHAARSEGGEDGRRHAAAESEARHRARRSPSWRSARRSSRRSTRRAARRSPSARGSCRRRRASVRSPTPSAPPSASRPGRSTATTSRRSIASRRTRSSRAGAGWQEREGRERRRQGRDRQEPAGHGRRPRPAPRSPTRCRLSCWAPLDRAADTTMVSSSRRRRARRDRSAPASAARFFGARSDRSSAGRHGGLDNRSAFGVRYFAGRADP